MGNSGVALAVSQVTKEKNAVFLVTGAATSALTGKPARGTRSSGRTTSTRSPTPPANPL